MTKRALTIACPFQGLSGPINDAELMETLLTQQGFSAITRCWNSEATCDGIKNAWRRLNTSISADDTVVIFYSGHGGVVEPPVNREPPQSGGVRIPTSPRRYQFLVPMDYDLTAADDFRGILEVELAHLLRGTTDRTKNVTVILDCCHAGRMSRHVGRAVPKRIPEIQHCDVSTYLARLADGDQEKVLFAHDNPYAVRIAAAATGELAWEYWNPQGKCHGALTEALASIMGNSQGHLSESWRNLILKVGESVNANFPQQHPQVEGRHNRIPFSLREATTPVINVRMEGNVVTLAAGRVEGVRQYNEYEIFPHDRATTDAGMSVAEATAINVHAFRSQLDVRFKSDKRAGPRLLQGGQAVLRSEAPIHWPVEIPDAFPQLRDRAAQSTNIRAYSPEETAAGPTARFRQEGERVILRTAEGAEIASQPATEARLSTEAATELMEAVEQLSQGQSFLSLPGPKRPEEVLDSNVEIEVGLVDSKGRGEPLKQTDELCLVEHQRIYIRMHNRSRAKIFMNILNINVAGKINLLASGFPNGIELAPGEVYTLGEHPFGGIYDGLLLSWPSNVPRDRWVGESLLFLLTDLGVDLRDKVRPPSSKDCKAIMDGRCDLERHVHRMRDIPSESRRQTARYATQRIDFYLRPGVASAGGNGPSGTRGPIDLSGSDIETTNIELYIPADHVPLLETSQAYRDLLTSLNVASGSSKGLLGAAWRTARGIPPYIKVINEHVEPITVVVSKDRPRRLLSGVGFNVSADGLGLTYETATYSSPAVRKTLPSRSSTDEPSLAVFPLWTRREGYGVISIFTGPDQTLFIENDRAPIGATLIFRNEPDMRTVMPVV